MPCNIIKIKKEQLEQQFNRHVARWSRKRWHDVIAIHAELVALKLQETLGNFFTKITRQFEVYFSKQLIQWFKQPLERKFHFYMEIKFYKSNLYFPK